jgi:O-antigen ligase
MPMRLPRVVLAGALVFAGLVGGSEAGQFLVAVRAIAAAIGGVIIAAYLLQAPRRHDRLDLAVLLGLLAFLTACVTSSIPRLSFDAATTAVAYAAAFYVARDAVSDADGRRLAITVLGLMGALVAIGYFAAWSAAWLRWASVPGAGIPPVGLALPPAPYGHHYLVGTLAAILLPACVAHARRPLVWPIGVAGSIAGIAVVLMSGSRTVWLSLVVALVVAVATGARLRRPAWRWVLPALAVALVGFALVGGDLVRRLATTSTVESRLEIYAASVERWLDAPLLGHGPGTYSAQMVLAGHDELLTHGHNALVQMLVEGGALGLAGLLVIVGAVTVTALRRRPRDTVGLAGMSMFAAAALTDNPTVFGFLVVPAIAWASIACPREPGPMRTASRWASRSTLGLAGAGAVAVLATIGAAWFYEAAGPAAARGDSRAVVAALRTATALDPSHALYQRGLGAWLLADGAVDAALDRLERAVEANPADPAARRAVAIAAASTGDGAALAVAQRLVDLQPEDVASQLTLAYVARELGDSATMGLALHHALRLEPWMTASQPWHEMFGDDVGSALRSAHASWSAQPLDRQDEHGRARAWLAAMVGDASDVTDVPAAAAAATIDCRLEDALRLLGPTADSGLDAQWLMARVLVARAAGEPVDDYLTLASLRWPILVFLSTADVEGASPFLGLAFDVQVYGRRPIAAPARLPVFPTSESGFSAWLRDPVAAADRGAPDSGLAACR